MTEGGEGRLKTLGLEEVARNYHSMIDELKKHDYETPCRLIGQADTIYLYGTGNEQKAIGEEFKRIFLPVKPMLHGHDLAGALGNTAGREELVFLISMSGVPSVSITRQCSENLYIDSMGLRVEGAGKYETPIPYFILIGFLYLSYLSYLEREEDSCKSASQGSVQKSKK